MDHTSRYNAVRCEVCGVPWEDHARGCPRHEYRPEWSKVRSGKWLREIHEALTTPSLFDREEMK